MNFYVDLKNAVLKFDNIDNVWHQCYSKGIE